MATIDSLANETLSHIIEYLKWPSMPGWDNSGDLQEGRYDALRAAALVCARWREPAQHALFDELHLPDPEDSRRVLFFASSARPRYRTRSLCVNSRGRPHPAWLPVAEACAGLESLIVLDEVIDDNPMSISSWDCFAHPSFKGLKHLSLMFPENFKDASDTLSHIIEYLKWPSMPGWDNSGDLQEGRYDALRAAALVCARWREPAQRALFDELHLPDPEDSRRVLFFASSARPRYRTRSLCVNSRGRPHPAWLPVAEACAGLESLIVLDEVIDDNPMSISSWDCFAHPSFKGLKHLSLTTLPFRLTSLALWLDSTDEPSPSFLCALCASSVSVSLERLQLRSFNLETARRFFPILRSIAPRLRTLILDSSGSAFQSHYDVFAQFDSLTHLELNSALPWSEAPPSTLAFLSHILDNLPDPPTLQHLEVKDITSPSKEFSSILEHKKLSTIKEVVYRNFKVSEESVDSEGVEATRQVCEERGFRLKMIHG